MAPKGTALLRVLALSVLALAGIGSAQANVSLKNGNFFVSYQDMFYPSGFEPKIERIYNSKSSFLGMFGWGWGNEYEVKLDVSADGSVVVHEFGGGAVNRFVPVAFKPQELDAAVEKLTAAAQKSGKLVSAESVVAYKKRLRDDAEFRNNEWEALRKVGKIEARVLPVGTELVSIKYSYQKLTRVPNGYKRSFENGKTELFNDLGRLVKVLDKNNHSIEFTYSRDGKLEQLRDEQNRRMTFAFNRDGRVERIDGEGGKQATYQYNSMQELVATKDADGNRYTYKYSPDREHNLIEIGYSDKTAQQISYYGRDKLGNVRMVKERDGTVAEYGYDFDRNDRGHIKVSQAVKGPDGKVLSSSSYEYFMKHKADGEEWQYKLITVLDGERTETTYNECCGMPLIIKRGNEETTFEYDTKGRVTKKTTPFEVTELAYDPNAGKVTKVVKYSKQSRKQVTWSQFQYDGKGNLVLAKNSEGKGVKLFYDTTGRIRTMVDQSQRQINFRYNELSKPVEITDPKIGSIKVSYTPSGEPKALESPGGARVAREVTSAFQNLLDIIRPAGVTLSL